MARSPNRRHLSSVLGRDLRSLDELFLMPYLTLEAFGVEYFYIRISPEACLVAVGELDQPRRQMPKCTV